MKAVIKVPPRRKKRSFALWKVFTVIIGAIGLTTLAIHASDTIRIPGMSLVAGVGGSAQAPERCPGDMTYVPTSSGGFCIDRYETSAGELCSTRSPSNQFETSANIARTACTGVSVKGETPWVNVSLDQAMQICARVGKRLPTNGEWYRAALGTPDEVSKSSRACALGHIGQERADKTGMHDDCVSSYGAYDMVGNVWEWVDGNVVEGQYGGRKLPGEGYVEESDVEGVAVKTGTEPNDALGKDYFFMNPSDVRGMFRGGFWSMEEKAGVMSINATIPTSFVGNAVGFRCAK